MQADSDALFAALGISDEGPFTRAFSYSNEVWVGPSVVLRLTPPDRSWASAQEQDVPYRLPSWAASPTALQPGLQWRVSLDVSNPNARKPPSLALTAHQALKDKS